MHTAMVRAPKKALKLGRALKTAAKLPARVGGVANGRNRFQPLQGEGPVVLLRVRVLSCKELLAKDKNGVSDPCVVPFLLIHRTRTHPIY